MFVKTDCMSRCLISHTCGPGTGPTSCPCHVSWWCVISKLSKEAVLVMSGLQMCRRIIVRFITRVTWRGTFSLSQERRRKLYIVSEWEGTRQLSKAIPLLWQPFNKYLKSDAHFNQCIHVVTAVEFVFDLLMQRHNCSCMCVTCVLYMQETYMYMSLALL